MDSQYLSPSVSKMQTALDHHQKAMVIIQSIERKQMYGLLPKSERLGIYKEALVEQKVAYDIVNNDDKMFAQVKEGIISTYNSINENIKRLSND